MKTGNSKENKNTLNTSNSKVKEINFNQEYVKKTLREALRNTISKKEEKVVNKQSMIDQHSENLDRLDKLH